MENEIWKTYPEIEWLQGSNLGRVRTLDHYVTGKDGRKQLIKGRVLKQHRHKNGYMYVSFRTGGKIVHALVHRVVASCFIDNPDSLPQVNHIDCNPANNLVDNLEWCDGFYNQQYVEKYGKSRGQRVIAINLTTCEILCFPSRMEAARQLGAYQQHITDVIKCKRKSHHGFWFACYNSQASESVRTKFGDSVARKVEKLLNEED
ncbi:HNH homing endonuclease [Lactobacillus phage P1]|uniref:HNH homing endonuclease n=1 Tax=Lactobacillus phage P1 TaxID=1846168 RepID=A0A1S5RCT6_9CAUD|nr:HNH endonuclease [Lactobacillus phage P1]ANO57984.1 HNH homing endonuclease [Lactobacillus phage P1]APU93339.1 HNH homing endonuclease [Lactobacillus phage P2]